MSPLLTRSWLCVTTLLSLFARTYGDDSIGGPPSIIPTTPAAVFQDSSSAIDGPFTFALSVYQADNSTDNVTDLYLHMSAPSSYQWMGVGVGHDMGYALMWTAYPSRNGTGVTLSTRLATGHHEPEYADEDWACEQIWDDDATGGNAVTDGDNGTMTLSAVCRNAASWNNSMAFAPSVETNTTASFIYALGPRDGYGNHGGRVLRSDSPDASLNMHSYHGTFTMDVNAAVTNNSNAAGLPKPNGEDGTTWITANASPPINTKDDHNRVPAAHGVIMCLAFVIVFPIGALISRLTHRIMIHAAIQVVGSVLVSIGFVLGVVVSVRYTWSRELKTGHQVIGMLVFCSLGLQLGLGIVHHRICSKKRPQPTVMGNVHKYLGPVIVLAGLINVPIGLVLAGNPRLCGAYFGALVVLAVLGFGARWAYLRWGGSRKLLGGGSTSHQYNTSASGYGLGNRYGNGCVGSSRPNHRRESVEDDEVPLKPHNARESPAVREPVQTRSML